MLARSFLRQNVVQWAAANPKFRSLDQAIGKQGFKMVLLARLSPIFPFVLLNYFLGLTAVRTGAYILANLLGMLPATLLFVYIGAAARDAIAGQTDVSASFYQQILKYVGLAARLLWSSLSPGSRARLCARPNSSRKAASERIWRDWTSTISRRRLNK
ncbi:MAG TPA: VTT domain-containing protein [Candidatus Binatia bacterium]